MLLKVADAARILNCNPEVLRRNIKVWGVPHIRLCRSYRFTESALLAYCNRQMPSEEETCPTEGKEVVIGISVSKEYDDEP